MKKRILVTGGTGFIGNAFIEKSQKEYELYVLVRETSDIEKLSKLDVDILKYSDFESIEKYFKKYNFHGLVHFASNVMNEHTVSNITHLLNDNITFSTYLLEYSKKYNVRWFINTGTFWQNYDNKEYSPVNLYAATKQAFEDIAQYYYETSELNFVTIRLNDTFGENDNRPKIFNYWKENIETGDVLDMSPGEQIIDISYIGNIIDGYLELISLLDKDNERKLRGYVYSIHADEIMSLKELSKIFENIVGKKLNINWGGRSYRDREVMKPWTGGHRIPNWQQKISLEDAIKKTLGV